MSVNTNESLEIKIKYHSSRIDKIKLIQVGNWIDLRTVKDTPMRAGDFKIISLGVSMQLPKGYHALIVPRSSTFKKYRILQANGIGVIDESYCGNNDIWSFPAFAVEDTFIPANEIICQFMIIKNMPEVKFTEVQSLSNEDRGGFGSTDGLH
jgi:dUTP pyrophosphatase